MTDILNNDTFKQSQNRQKSILNNIQQLQDLEKELYNKLEAGSANNSTSEEETAIVKRINEISQMRATMFKELDAMYKSMQGRVSQTRVDLVDQMVVTGVVEKELNNAKLRLNALNDDKNNKMRMVEINTYYTQKYQAQSGLMKSIIIISLVLLVLAIISKKNLLPTNVMNGIIGVWIAISLIYIFRKLYDINSRDNMNFDEYNWHWDEADNSPTVIQYDEDEVSTVTKSLRDDIKNFVSSVDIGCVGENCCSTGTKYDRTQDKCVETFAGITESTIFPWKQQQTLVKPFSEQDNFVRF